jgi:glycyl-tRNA synthetase
VRRLRRGRHRRRHAHRPQAPPRARAGQGRRAPAAAQGGPPGAAREIHATLKRAGLQSEYDEGGSIGKRYRRQDEIGTPYGVTVDHQTLEDDTVTLRDRDTLTQERIAISALPDELHARLAAPWTSPKLV